MPTDSEFIDLPYAPIGGINTYDSEDNIGETEVASAQNMLFENKQAFSRPGLTTKASNINDTIKYIDYVGGDYAILINTALSKIFAVKVPNSGSEFQVTGAAPGFSVSFGNPPQIAYVNGVYLISAAANGMLRWDPTAGTAYTLMPTAKFRYVGSHYSRAVGAYDLSITGPTAGLDFHYSVPGDETTWTAGVGIINGSGTTLLNDADGKISSLNVLRNVVVLGAGSGLHLAYATGNGASPYNVQKWADNVPVPSYAPSRTWNNLMYYITPYGDVCTFDLNEVKSIGKKIQRKLTDLILSVQVAGGEITTAITLASASPNSTFNTVSQPRFNICVVIPGVETWHLTYSIHEGTWAIHEYGETAGWVGICSLPYDFAFGLANISPRGPVLYKNVTPGTNAYKVWDTNVPCERISNFKGKLFIVEKPEVDYVLNRACLGTRDFGVANVGVTVESRLNRQKNTATVFKNVGSSANDGYWGREWFDLLQAGTGSATGQMFQATVTSPAGANFACNYLGLRLQTAGDFRG